MRVLLDDQPISPDPGSVAEAMDAVRAHTEDTDRLIIQIEADGAPVDAELLTDPPDDDAGIGELRLTTANRLDFIRVTIGDVAEALDHVVEHQSRAAALIEDGDAAAASEPLSEALTKWQAVHAVVDQAAQLLGVDPGEIEIEPVEGSTGATTGAACIEKLLEALEEVRRAMSDQDTAALADTLREDMDAVSRDWRALLDALSQRAAA